MVDLDEALSAAAGYEFDWLLVDSEGAVALCLNAGFGEIPDAVLALGAERIDEYAAAVGEIPKALPENGGYREDGDPIDDSRPFAACGLYVYDWQHWSGPYKRIFVPGSPRHRDAVAPAMEGFLEYMPSVPIVFARTRSFYLPDLLDCRACGAAEKPLRPTKWLRRLFGRS